MQNVDALDAAYNERPKRNYLNNGYSLKLASSLTLATPSKENAQWMNGLAEEVLHYSPEPRVIERAIESAVLAGREDEALLHLARFRAAFPADYENWRTRQHTPLPP